MHVAYLELEFGYLRTLTPCYSTFVLTPTATWNRALEDKSPIAQVVMDNLRGKTIDVYQAARSAGVQRALVQKKITSWDIS